MERINNNIDIMDMISNQRQNPTLLKVSICIATFAFGVFSLLAISGSILSAVLISNIKKKIIIATSLGIIAVALIRITIHGITLLLDLSKHLQGIREFLEQERINEFREEEALQQLRDQQQQLNYVIRLLRRGEFERISHNDDSNEAFLEVQEDDDRALCLKITKKTSDIPIISNDFEYEDIPSKYEEDEVLSQFICPITRSPIRYPVTLRLRNKDTGIIHEYTYERNAIIRLFKGVRRIRDPISRKTVTIEDYHEDIEKRKIIEDQLKILDAQ